MRDRCIKPEGLPSVTAPGPGKDAQLHLNHESAQSPHEHKAFSRQDRRSITSHVTHGNFKITKPHTSCTLVTNR
jgi:hypothetical protein